MHNFIMYEIPLDFFGKDKSTSNSQSGKLIAELATGRKMTSEEVRELTGAQRPAAIKWSLTHLGALIEGNGTKKYPYELKGFTVGFGNPKMIKAKDRELLYRRQNGKCNLCGVHRDIKDLQSDHRIPFAVVGNKYGSDLYYWQLACRSCNASKRAQCERCPVATDDSCGKCRLARPAVGEHTHIRGDKGISITTVVSEEELKDIQYYADKYQLSITLAMKKLIQDGTNVALD